MLATKPAQWSAATAVLCLAVLAASWFLLVDPRRSEASELRTQTADAQARIPALETQLEELRAEFADLPRRRAELAEIRRQLPPRDDVPPLVRDLESYAARAGVALAEVTPGAPVAVTTSITAGAAATPAPAAGAAAAAPVASVYAIPMTMKVSGEYVEVSLFVKYLQTKLDRSFLITGVDLAKAESSAAAAQTTPDPATTPGATASPAPVVEEEEVSATVSRVDLTLTGQVFVLLGADAAKAKAAAAGGTTAPSGSSAAPAAS